MRRHLPGLHESTTSRDQEIPDGFFLVRVERATYRGYKEKLFLALQLLVIEPRQFASCRFSARLYCTARALWKLNWFLRDFSYDTVLLGQDQIDDKALTGLQGVVKVSHSNFNGRSYLNLDGFAQATDVTQRVAVRQGETPAPRPRPEPWTPPTVVGENSSGYEPDILPHPRADGISVQGKSSPLKSSASPIAFASA
jgi:hypothetical protein